MTTYATFTFTNIFAQITEDTHYDTLNQAVLSYQTDQDDETFAYIYKSVHRQAMRLRRKYSLIDEQEFASTLLAELHKAILGFDFENGTKFSTFYLTYLSRAFASQMKSLNYDIRSVNLVSDSYEGMVENGFDLEGTTNYGSIELLESLPSDLSDLEHKYCEIILTNRSADDTDIAHLLQISNVKVYRLKKSLQNKLNFLLQA